MVKRSILVMSLQARLHRTVRIRTVQTFRTRRSFRHHVRIISHRINTHTFRATHVRRTKVNNRDMNLTLLIRVVRRVRMNKKNTRGRRQFTINHNLIRRTLSTHRVGTVLVRRRTTTFNTTLLRNTNRVSKRQQVLIRIPYKKRSHSTSTLTIKRSRVPRQRSRQLIPRLRIKIRITPTLAKVHNATNNRRHFTVLFKRKNRHRRFRTIRQRKKGLRPINRHLQHRTFKRTMNTM